MKIRLGITLLLSLGIVGSVKFSYANTGGLDLTAIYADLEKSVVKVTAGVNGSTRKAIGTGFVWQKNDFVITALHIVAGRDDIKIDCKGQKLEATVLRVYKRADLALLEVQGQGLKCEPMTQRNDEYPRNIVGGLSTIGFLGGSSQRSAIGRNFSKGHVIGSENLNGLLPRSSIDQVRIVGMPALDLAIYHINGSLLPGFSGAPIVNLKGQLIGIGNGGIEEGAKQISWVIPSVNIDKLLQSDDDKKLPIASINELFSAEIDMPYEDIIAYTSRGVDFRFVKTKTRSLSDMVQTSDDPNGLTHLLGLYQDLVVQGAIESMMFDVYEEIDRGIILTVPAGQRLEIKRNGPTVQWLASTTKDEDGRSLATMQYWEQGNIRGSDNVDITPDNPRYFTEIISEHLSGSTDPGSTFAEVDNEVLRITDFGDSNRVLKAGYKIVREGSRRLVSYDYISVAAKSNVSYRAAVRLYSQNRGLLYCTKKPSSPVCLGDKDAMTKELAALISIHLTTLSNIFSQPGQAALETRFVHNNEFDDPDTLRRQFHFGPDNQVYFNARGVIWKEYGVVDNTIRNFTQYRKDDVYVYLEFLQDHVALPYRGGKIYRSSDGGKNWQPSETIRVDTW